MLLPLFCCLRPMSLFLSAVSQEVQYRLRIGIACIGKKSQHIILSRLQLVDQSTSYKQDSGANISHLKHSNDVCIYEQLIRKRASCMARNTVVRIDSAHSIIKVYAYSVQYACMQERLDRRSTIQIFERVIFHNSYRLHALQ